MADSVTRLLVTASDVSERPESIAATVEVEDCPGNLPFGGFDDEARRSPNVVSEVRMLSGTSLFGLGPPQPPARISCRL